jgi:ABC-type glycerol-3-phosphate transport system substrate-binding protein
MVGLSQFSVRIFYNKDLFKKILGTDTPPKDLSQFFNYCQRIQDYVEKENKEIERYNKRTEKNMPWWQFLPFVPSQQKELRTLVPIASSKYQVKIFKGRYLSMLTADLALELDQDMDGNLVGEEKIRALVLGELAFDNEKIKAASELLRDMAKYFTPGFMSGDRMESGFAFVQSRAAMITSGSWDAKSFIKQVKDQPFGDIILEINGVKTDSAAKAESSLLKFKNDKSVKILISREGGKKLLKIHPSPSGDSLWNIYGFRLKNVLKDNKNLVVVDEVDSISPAANSGFMERRTFEVGIFDFPAPGKDDPKFGKLVAGPVAESSTTGFRFGITKFSQNKELALDFFRFCTTPENNEKFNEIAQWIPAVKGAKPSKMLRAFVPNFKGYWGNVTFGANNNSLSSVREKQIFWPYISGEIDYKKYSEDLKKTMPRPMASDYDSIVMTKAENLPDKMVQRSMYLAKYVFSRDKKDIEEAKRKLTASWDVILDYELSDARLKALMTPVFNETPPDNQFSKDFLRIFNEIKTKR